MARKFQNPRYLTRGIADKLPMETQVFLWGLIDAMEIEKQDYLQVFTLSAENGRQKIIHHQEEPEYLAEFVIPATDPVNAKIFVIDDDTHSTMLFADEY